MANEPSPKIASNKVKVLHAAVDAFRRREVNFRDILEDLPAAIYTTDAEGNLTYFNKACVEFSGRTPVLGNDQWCVTWKLYMPDGRSLPHAECPMAVALREGRPNRGIEAIAERPDGTRINFIPYPNPIFDEAGDLIGAVNMLVDVTEQKKTEERMAMMAREVDHRANNLLAVMQSLLHLTKADSIEEYRETLQGRFWALAKVNALIAVARWRDVDFKALVHEELSAFSDRTLVNGDSLSIAPNAAQNVAIIIHELATNAVKYGALSVADGAIHVSWSVDFDDFFMLRWTERGGPAVDEPTRSGTGSAIIKAAVRYLQGEIFREWTSSGLICTFICKRSTLDAT